MLKCQTQYLSEFLGVRGHSGWSLVWRSVQFSLLLEKKKHTKRLVTWNHNHSNQYNSNDQPKLKVLFRLSQPVASPSLLSSSSRVGLNSRWSLRLTKQYRHSPFTLWGRLTTAASATDRCPIRAASTSAVLIRWPGGGDTRWGEPFEHSDKEHVQYNQKRRRHMK